MRGRGPAVGECDVSKSLSVGCWVWERSYGEEAWWNKYKSLKLIDTSQHDEHAARCQAKCRRHNIASPPPSKSKAAGCQPRAKAMP